ncbi:hypothetical protein OGM63_29405 [Plectonema radiosum NIES-515]|uniref:Uncharacterized protein n=1 Tax=Plectonema radiosum NIES-515 TaxID=2986073 RepID=A0ABT3B8A9_9CYAN|nr:hypothetical protein [Plectonema radiosum]MCV3217579.1 hypothetical protein [Plectonema radiosum NIES-515]
MTTNIDTNLSELMEDCDRLNGDERAKLLKHLFGDAEFNVTVGSSQFNADTLYQISTATVDQLSEILQAIAHSYFLACISKDTSEEINLIRHNHKFF